MSNPRKKRPPAAVASDFSEASETTPEQSGSPSVCGTATEPVCADSPAVEYVTLRVPIGQPREYPDGGHQYQLRRCIDPFDLDRREGVALLRLFAGLDQSGARLESGAQVVYQGSDSIRWLLGQVASAIEDCGRRDVPERV